MTGERRPWAADDLGVVGAGVVVFVLSWLPWYVATLGPGERVRFRAWDLGVLSTLAVLFSMYAALRVFWLRYRPLDPDAPVTPGVEPLVAAVVGLLLVLYRSLDVPTVPLAARVAQTVWLIAALFAAVFQAVFALRAVARTGFRQ